MDGSRGSPAQTVGGMPQRPRTGGFAWLWAAAVLVPLGGFGLAAWTASGAVEVEARGRLTRTVDMLHEHALRALETQEAILAAIDGRIRGMDWAAIAADPELHRFLRELDRNAPSTAGTALIRPDGRLAAASRVAPPASPVDLSERDYVRAVRDAPQGVEQGTFIGEVVVSRPSGLTVFTMSQPRLDAAGVPDGGVLTATFSPARFAEFYQAVVESSGDAVTLIRADGVVLARAPPLPDPVGSRLPLGSGVLQAFGRAEGGRGVTRGAGAFDGVDRLIAFRRVGDYPMLVSYGLDVAVLRQAWLRQLVAPGLGAIASASLLLLLTARSQAASRAGQREAEHRADCETARAAAEAELRHGERVGALGRLAAGVAHDFGNAVQSIASGARLLERHADAPDRVRRYAELIAEAADRAGALTARMRNFARRGDAPDTATRLPVDVATALNGVCELLSRSLGGSHRLRCEIPATLPFLPEIDRAELEAAVVNLVLNARDAMPAGGEVRVFAAEQAATGPLAGAPPTARCVRIAVSDGGVGMDAPTLARAGEAFFTTKGPDRGTGLGLSMARGFAERAGGAMAIESAPGEGTTVTLWLPTGPPVA